MPFKFKVDVLQLLRQRGFSSYQLRKHKILGESAIQRLRSGQMVSLETLDVICELTGLQPADLIEHVPDDSNSEGRQE